MAIEVLLMQDVKDLGSQGQVVSVKEGFARNYLFVNKLAAPVTDATRRQLAKLQKVREAEKKVELDAARTRAAAIEKGSYTITMKVGEGDKLFGSVTPGDIVKVIGAQGFEVEKHAVVLDNPIKELGVYEVKVKIHPEVEAVIKVWVVQE
ncbi:MAG: 50S ribosomal protein L9 [bacterium]|jgi:large subunit ribosomal protein L9